MLSSKHNWWLKYDTFPEIWQALLERYQNHIAYYAGQESRSYIEVEKEAQLYRQQFSNQKIVRINGLEPNWLTQAIAAWTKHQVVVFFNPEWQISEKQRYMLSMSEPEHIDWQADPHLFLFTSGSTGVPKPIIRYTDLALFEAASYIEDVLQNECSSSICLIKPWFGAITKHCLGMLFAGIPQYFSLELATKEKQNTLIYATPSLISQHAHKYEDTYLGLSLTGERIHAKHIQAFKSCLNKQGFILNAYGSSECGVIARKQVTYTQMDELLISGFSGAILPGKYVYIDEQNKLFVGFKQNSAIETGDLAQIEGQTLTLLGRHSLQRKIRGRWYDASPLINLLHKHPDIYHHQLYTEQTTTDQLIVHINADASICITALYEWLFEHLRPIKLLPRILLSHDNAALSVTGKSKLNLSRPQIHNPDYISMMSESILKSTLADTSYLDTTLEDLGFDSIDIVALFLSLKTKLKDSDLFHNILKTDTPRQISEQLNSSLFRSIGSDDPKKDTQLLCLGSGILQGLNNTSGNANIKYTDIINQQIRPFSISQVAKLIIEREFDYFRSAKKLYIAGYSIHALLALELAYQLEQLKQPVQGVFLLDPPHAQRLLQLKLKKYFLVLRSHLLSLSKTKCFNRYTYELRKLAICKQPKRHLATPSLTVSRSPSARMNPCLLHSKHHQLSQINFSDHIELVTTEHGIQTWSELFAHFLEQ